MSAPNILNVAPNATNGDYSASSSSAVFSATRSIGSVANGATSATLFTINPALFPTPGARYFVTFCMSVDNIVYAVAPLFTGFLTIRVTQDSAMPFSGVSIPAVNANAVNSAYVFNIQTVVTRNSTAIIIDLRNFSGQAISSGDIDIFGMTIQEMPAPVGLLTGPEA